MEYKTKKTIVYRIKNVTACTYEIDDTPPFLINKEALRYAVGISLLLGQNLVGEMHIIRKQYLDGSIPTGFQRTAIIGLNGQIILQTGKKINLIQLSIEEDSCREVEDIGHRRVYITDRLGVPLIEVVTAPEMKTPWEVKEAALCIRYSNRSTGHVRVGSGGGREDVNVSISGGVRVEIKGVSRIKLIPKLVHNEAFRQKALLDIRDILRKRVDSDIECKISSKILDSKILGQISSHDFYDENYSFVAVNIPYFKDVLSFFTQPDKPFADELSSRLKVIACIEKPNMISSEELFYEDSEINGFFEDIRNQLKSGNNDAQIVFRAYDDDISTALETIQERVDICFEGVPEETRKSFFDGTTIFERVLPGSDRMYPDTDSAPVTIKEDFISEIKNTLPISLDKRYEQLREWKIPLEHYQFILRNNLMPLMEQITNEYFIAPKFISSLLAQNIKQFMGRFQTDFDFSILRDLFKFLKHQNINYEISRDLVEIICKNPKMTFDSILKIAEFEKKSENDILSEIDIHIDLFKNIYNAKCFECAAVKWIMGKLHRTAIGNISLSKFHNSIISKINSDAGVDK